MNKIKHIILFGIIMILLEGCVSPLTPALNLVGAATELSFIVVGSTVKGVYNVVTPNSWSITSSTRGSRHTKNTSHRSYNSEQKAALRRAELAREERIRKREVAREERLRRERQAEAQRRLEIAKKRKAALRKAELAREKKRKEMLRRAELAREKKRKAALHRSNSILKTLAKKDGYKTDGRFNSYNDSINFLKSNHTVAQAIVKKDNFQVKCSYDEDFKTFDSEQKSFFYISKHCFADGIDPISKKRYQVIKGAKIIGYIEAMDNSANQKNYRWSIYDKNHILKDEYLNLTGCKKIFSLVSHQDFKISNTKARYIAKAE